MGAVEIIATGVGVASTAFVLAYAAGILPTFRRSRRMTCTCGNCHMGYAICRPATQSPTKDHNEKT